MNIKEQYFDPLHKISNDVHDFISEAMDSLKKNSTLELYEEIQHLHKKRSAGSVFRAFLTEQIYKSLSTANCNALVGACSLSEINNYNAYLDNWILDNKNDLWGLKNVREKISYVTIASGIYRELQESVVINLDIAAEQKMHILEILSSCMTFSYQGQALDMKMSIETFDSNQTDQEYLDLYIERSFKQSGYLYGASTEIGAVLAKADTQMLGLARNIGRTIGTGLHISNDLGDFAILTESGDFKGYQDQMADLRNGHLTLPIWYVLKYGSEYEQNVFRSAVGKSLSQVDPHAILEVLHSSGAYDYCKKVIRRYYSESKELIDKLPESGAKLSLKYASVVIKNNKYLSNLRRPQQ